MGTSISAPYVFPMVSGRKWSQLPSIFKQGPGAQMGSCIQTLALCPRLLEGDAGCTTTDLDIHNDEYVDERPNVVTANTQDSARCYTQSVLGQISKVSPYRTQLTLGEVSKVS